MGNVRLTSFLAPILIVFLASALEAQDPAMLSIGEKAPAFSLKGIDGKTYTLDSFQEAKVLYRHDGIIDPLEVKQAVVKELGRYFADDP